MVRVGPNLVLNHLLVDAWSGQMKIAKGAGITFTYGSDYVGHGVEMLDDEPSFGI